MHPKFLVFILISSSQATCPAPSGKSSMNGVEIFRRVDAPEVTLVMRWFPGRCLRIVDRTDIGPPCKIDALRPFWTIKEVKGQLKNCETYGNERIPSDLKQRLTEVWPSFYDQPKEYENFWLREYRKDGSCFRRQNHPFLGSVWKFFSASLYLVMKRDVFAALATKGIIPSVTSYTSESIAQALRELHTARVRLVCGYKQDFLIDVEFCFNDFLKPIDCSKSSFVGTCAEFVFYAPPPALPRNVHNFLERNRRVEFEP